MAKSKNGGTRALIRGRVGSDVYSVGKNAAGQHQQVVRSLAESVANPRTEQQMFGRMVMSTVMQAVSALKPIIDHSFDGLPAGQPSISEFIRRNYQLVKADAIEHPVDGNYFGLNSYQEKGVKAGPFVISNGEASLPSIVAAGDRGISLNLGAAGATVADLKNALGLSSEGYITYVAIQYGGGADFVRIHLKADLDPATVISSENVATLFEFDGTKVPTVRFTSPVITINLFDDDNSYAYGAIVSEKLAGTWIHNQCVLAAEDSMGASSAIALPTYPIGEQMFLNGGEL